MKKRKLDIFVDESGSFSYPDEMSRFYIICALLHDPEVSIDDCVARLDRSFESMKLSNLCFHAGPIIRHEGGFEYMNWELRSSIFAKMMAFARSVDFSYRCICVDKKFVAGLDQMAHLLHSGLRRLVSDLNAAGEDPLAIRVFYDNGQAQITHMLRSAFQEVSAGTVEFVPEVRPSRYKLFQLADLLCTVELIAQKLSAGLSLTKSENVFFGGAKAFRHNILRRLRSKAF